MRNGYFYREDFRITLVITLFFNFFVGGNFGDFRVELYLKFRARVRNLSRF